jgi:hypothetical protein
MNTVEVAYADVEDATANKGVVPPFEPLTDNLAQGVVEPTPTSPVLDKVILIVGVLPDGLVKNERLCPAPASTLVDLIPARFEPSVLATLNPISFVAFVDPEFLLICKPRLSALVITDNG